MNPQGKAKELIEKYLNTPINFPYIDKVDGNCIGEGYMTHHSAKECAKIAVNEILIGHMIIAVQHFWKSVLTEIDKY